MDSLPPGAARRVLDCDSNFKKADSWSCLSAQSGFRQQSVCDMLHSFKKDDRLVQSGELPVGCAPTSEDHRSMFVTSRPHGTAQHFPISMAGF
ncbi:hypothetical protein ABMY26_09890 [Azospirillum sp. HJ39]|uniref:hypothetical protein n=1 Tax=Azospirillum sp. HJ39 TaxID=3159496 RepID=UPI0035571E66